MTLICCSSFLKILFIFSERGTEKERERNINVWLPLVYPLVGTWPTTQACALTGNRTSDPLDCRPACTPLSHTSQGSLLFFNHDMNEYNHCNIFTCFSYLSCFIKNSLSTESWHYFFFLSNVYHISFKLIKINIALKWTNVILTYLECSFYHVVII